MRTSQYITLNKDIRVMDPLDKAILGSFYLSSLDPRVAALDG